jgi:hypothetical protein
VKLTGLNPLGKAGDECVVVVGSGGVGAGKSMGGCAASAEIGPQPALLCARGSVGLDECIVRTTYDVC